MNSSLARGLYHLAQDLRGERVGSRLRELMATERWPAGQLHELHWQRLRALVRHAWETVPWYRERWGEAGFEPGDLKSAADWDRLPCLSKDELRTAGARLLSTRRERGLAAATSGSSGQPVVVDRSHASWGYAHAAVLRGWRWHGVEAGDRYAYFWGAPLDQRGARRAGWKDRFFNRERLNAFRIDAGSAREFAGRLRRQPARFAFGYPSALAAFARELERAGIDGREFRWRVAITSAEVLHDHQRELLGRVFGCGVVDSYGCAEVGVAGFECEHGGMHVPVEAVRVDAARFDASAPELLLTDLFNWNQPVLRYRVGDLVEPLEGGSVGPVEPLVPAPAESPDHGTPGPGTSTACPCGRALPRMGRVAGRAGDVLALPDGRQINANLPSYIFKKHGRNRTVDEYQFVQFADGRVELRVIQGPAWTDDVKTGLVEEVRTVLGLEVALRTVGRIPRRGRAKHRDFVQVSDLEGADEAEEARR